MSTFTNECITAKGEQLIAKSLAGATITFTKMVLGDGYSEFLNLKNATYIVHPVKEIEIDSVIKNNDSSVTVQSSFNNSDITDTFYYREKGIFATDGTEEILFIYANAGDAAEPIYPYSQAIIEKKISSIFIPSGSGSCTIEYKTHDYADADAFDEHVDDIHNPHKVTKEQLELGNVPNVTTNDQTPTYEVAASIQTLSSGEKISIAFGKIKAAVNGLIEHLELLATATIAGHVKLSRSSAITTAGSYALDALEKNASVAGTLAYQQELLNTSLASKAASISVSGTTLTLKKSDGTPLSTVITQDTNTWRGIVDNVGSTSRVDSLSAYQGYLLNLLIAQKVIFDDFTSPAFNVSANSLGYADISIGKSGYTPVAVTPINYGSGNSIMLSTSITSASVIRVQAFCTSAKTGITPAVRVFYIK